ncbi:ribbon-helix-helix protein, CopG family [Coprobacillus sp. AF15-30]|nr:ribbon-helix-helix protein, CopG family [Coprobacillus sp. AF15-30]
MSPRTGRPKIDNPKSNRITVRMDDNTLNILQNYCKKENVDKAEAIRRGIEKLGK